MPVINQEAILYEEIVCEDDKSPDAWQKILDLIFLLIPKGYRLELWYADGQRCPHLYIIIPELESLDVSEREEYKKLFLKKYLPTADLNLCEDNRLISARNKPHFKYNTIKRKLGEWNVRS